MFNTTTALVLREVRYKEADRILTLLTASDGRVSAKARGALRKGSKIAAATQQLTFSEMTLFMNNGKWNVNEASIIEGFAGLRLDIEKLALGSYISECVEAVSVEGQSDSALLQLALNTLFALSNSIYDNKLIKAGFELRLMSIAGYEPELNSCAVCGRKEPIEPLLSLDDGCICCKKCRSIATGDTAELCVDSLSALRYVISAPAKQIFSFTIGDAALNRLSKAAEAYLLKKTERRFGTLDYYKRVTIV